MPSQVWRPDKHVPVVLAFWEAHKDQSRKPEGEQRELSKHNKGNMRVDSDSVTS